jgi:2-polyprenyl-3-methyl-5-hydroxy-6-metoxy-1,4-benzoquinol methylase
MYELLKRFASRPGPHSENSISTLWTQPHIADRMLSYHLDQDNYLASRPEAEIRKIVESLNAELDLRGKRVCDLGCGPGLYARRFAALGATVTGVDISENSIAFARRQQPIDDKSLQYIVADYLLDALGGEFDVVTLIYFDLCALSPADRSGLLGRIHTMLKPGGFLVLDVVSENALREAAGSISIENSLMDGFWSAADYVGVLRKWVYDDLQLTLDHYGIFEKDRHFEVFNWMQFFSEERLTRELTQANFRVVNLHGSLNFDSPLGTGDSTEIGVIAQK